MDFVWGLPKIKRQHDSIWVVVNRLTKSAPFLPTKVDDLLDNLAKLYVKEVVKLHGVPVSIISDRDTRFTTRFWRSFQRAMGTQLRMSTTFHPQTDGQSERTIQTLEDMLRACALDFSGSWDERLPLIEFAYNNNYHPSIGMAPFEALYGSKCRTLVCWTEVGEKQMLEQMLGLEIVQKTTEKSRVLLLFFSPAPNKSPKPDSTHPLRNDLLCSSVRCSVCGCDFIWFLIPKFSPNSRRLPQPIAPVYLLNFLEVRPEARLTKGSDELNG
ncbi:hypothetical protein SLEP1_g39460 [Rubroshorea leprosula]|uniref:Integrase catalytic domain-containing protein n=1 Tax=Rubroshorea leprosula TaxID=152421 RepID=A0AAV5L1G0_9ROSI|nr:hypothetical protein SLEP1_g39460 [Rubroshorea leprosula]